MNERNRRTDNVFQMDSLESRTLLSHGIAPAHRGGGFGGGFGHAIVQSGNTIQFSQAPTAVQAGINSLISDSGGTQLDPTTSTQTIYLANTNGVEQYSVILSAAGTRTRFTVDQNGDPVTAPTTTTTTWATLNGTGADSNSDAAASISNIADALDLTAPTDTTRVTVTTDGTQTVYSIRLAKGTGWRARTSIINVDQDGNPVGNQNLPFSALPTAIQDGLNNAAPDTADALDPASSQIVNVRTLNGVTTYSTKFSGTGTTTVVTVDAAGNPATLPSQSTDTFDNIPQDAQDELQALATADGVAGDISTDQSVRVYDEGNGTVVYSVRVLATGTTSRGRTYTYPITLSVDQDGNPTVPPTNTGACLFGGSGFGLGGIGAGWGGPIFGGGGFGMRGFRF